MRSDGRRIFDGASARLPGPLKLARMLVRQKFKNGELPMGKLDLEPVMAKQQTLNTIGFELSNLKRYRLPDVI